MRKYATYQVMMVQKYDSIIPNEYKNFAIIQSIGVWFILTITIFPTFLGIGRNLDILNTPFIIICLIISFLPGLYFIYFILKNSGVLGGDYPLKTGVEISDIDIRFGGISIKWSEIDKIYIHKPRRVQFLNQPDLVIEQAISTQNISEIDKTTNIRLIIGLVIIFLLPYVGFFIGLGIIIHTLIQRSKVIKTISISLAFFKKDFIAIYQEVTKKSKKYNPQVTIKDDFWKVEKFL